MQTELTQELVDSLKPRKTRYDATDKDNPGFGLRIYPSGVKTYFYRYRIKNMVRFMQLCRASCMPLSVAKRHYEYVRDRKLQGIDPRGRDIVKEEAYYKFFDIAGDLDAMGRLPKKLGNQPSLEDFSAHYGMSQAAVRMLAAYDYLTLLTREGRKKVVPLKTRILQSYNAGDLGLIMKPCMQWG